MLKIKKILFVVLILFSYNYSYCIIDPVFHNSTIKDGLFHANAQAIVQDNDGYIWIGTSEGLQRYDGKTYKYYGLSNKANSMLSNFVSSLYFQDNKNVLWIGCKDGILTKFDLVTYTFTNFQINYSDKNQILDISQIIYYDKNNLLIATNLNSGLLLFNIESNTFKKIDIFDTENIQELYQIHIKNDYIYASTEKGLLKISKDFSSIKLFTVHDFNSSKIISISEYAEDELIISSLDNIYEFDTKLNTYTNITPSDFPKIEIVKHIKADKNDIIWIATKNNGLIKLNINTNKFYQYKYNQTQEASLSSNNISTIYFSQKNSIIWLGTFKGISFFSLKSNTFRNYIPTTIENEPIDLFFSILKASNNSFWLSDFYNNVYYSDNINKLLTKITTRNSRLGLLGKRDIMKIIESPDSIIWFGTKTGLISYNYKTQKIREFKVSEKVKFHNYYNRITNLRYSKNTIWISSNAGISSFNIQTNKFTCYPPPENNDLNKHLIHTRDILYDNNENIWFGEFNNGVYKYNLKTGKYIHYINEKNNKKSLCSNDIVALFIDSENSVWITTIHKGISRYNSDINSFTNYSINNGLPSNNIYEIIEDKDKHLWLSTNRGISAFNLKTNEFTNYGFNDGVNIYEFNMNSSCKTFNGEILFGGIGGVVSFYPKEIISESDFPKIFISDLYIQNKQISPNSKILNNKSITYTKDLDLEYQKSNIRFDISIINFLLSSKNQFAWKLDNYETSWNYSHKNQNSISYTNLPPGKYILLLKNTKDKINWSDTKQILNITIKPPLWLTSWFRIGVWFFVGVLLLVFYNFRIYYYKKQKEALNIIIDKKTNELRLLNNNLIDRNAEIQTQNEELLQYRYHLEELVDDRTVQLKKALDKAKESDEFKTRIILNLSHEIRTPLNAIIGYSSIIANNTLSDKETQEFSVMVEDSGKSLINLIDNIIKLSDLESSNEKFNLTYFDLNKTINDIISYYSEDLSKNITIIPQVLDKNYTIYSDRKKITHCISELLGNAINYTENGTITIGYGIYSSEEIFANYSIKLDSKNKSHILFYVKDTGIGISEEQQKYIFDIFKKVEDHTNKLYRGLGIGLSVLRQYVEILDGKVWINSTVNQGSEFYFTIPYISQKQN